jgi:predicted ATPase
MATGQHPFYSDSTAGYLRSIASRHPIPPSRLKPEIPAWFEALLVRMLQKRPDKRCAATEIVAAFRDQGESLDPRGLSLANSMPGGPESNHKELDLLSALESTLIDRKRLASDEFLDMHRPVQVPPKKEGDPSTTFLAQAGMFWRAIASSDFANARGHAELCLRSAEEKGDSGLIMQAHYMFAQVFFHLGEHFECDRRIRKAISLYDPARHAKLVETSGIDVRANGTALLGLNLWYLGFSDQSRTKVRESIEIARTAPHPAPLAFALIMQTFLHDFLGDPQIMQDGSREVTAIAVEHNLQADTWFWGKFGTGWALAKLGKTEEGWAEMRSAMADADQIGMAYAMPTFGWALACSLAQNGWAEDARALIDRYLPHVEQSGPREKLSELYRLKGELLLGRNLESDAKRLFESALDAARKSGALAHELRAAVSLARLYLKMGQPAAGRRILPPVFDLFTEGFETPDLREARVLIQELSEETTSGPMCA